MPKSKKSETILHTDENELQIPSPTAAETGEAVPAPSASEATKPKRASRKKKVESEQTTSKANAAASKAAAESNDPASLVNATKETKANTDDSILTIVAYDEIPTPINVEATIWHEIRDAYYTRKMLTGTLDGVEDIGNGSSVAVVHYKGFRIIIPLTEMTVSRKNVGEDKTNFQERMRKLLNRMLGSEIDFIIRGIDPETRSIVASRRDAMLKKRQTFYLDRDASGKRLIIPGRKVQARIVLVAEKVIYVEIFGVETRIFVRDLSWHWIGDARDHYFVGNTILLRVTNVIIEDLENIKVFADARSMLTNTSKDMFLQCRIQGKYAGKVTDIQNGVIYVRLSNGVNAIAHSCMDHRTPGKKDDVSFVVTKLDEDWCVAIGIVTRIIRQNL